jgi:hypothetical protein
VKHKKLKRFVGKDSERQAQRQMKARFLFGHTSPHLNKKGAKGANIKANGKTRFLLF